MQIRVAAIIAVAVLVASGWLYRTDAQRLGRKLDGVVLPRGTLNSFPMLLGTWQGKEMSLPEEIVEATDTDDHLIRGYFDRATNRRVAIFVAYGIQLRDLAPHRPEVCYPSSGWTSRGIEVVEVPLAGGGELPCRILSFERSGFSTEKQTVLNYYIVDGEYCPDVSLLRSRQRDEGGSESSYAVQVQISTTTDFVGDSPSEIVKSFASVVGTPLREFVDEAVKQHVRAAKGE